MNQTVLRQLSEERLSDALVLLDQSRWSGAYYLTGYAVECALKACIAKYAQQGDFPDQKFVQNCHTHDLNTLRGIADLKDLYEQESKNRQNLGTNWDIVKGWNERARYRLWTQGRRI